MNKLGPFKMFESYGVLLKNNKEHEFELSSHQYNA